MHTSCTRPPQALYERLFDYLVSAINEGLSASAPAPPGGQARPGQAHSASARRRHSDAERSRDRDKDLPFFGVLDIFGAPI